MEVYQEKEVKKFTRSFKLDDYEILTDSGYVDVKYLHETIPYQVYELKLVNGMGIRCADDHIVYLSDGSEIFVKDLITGDVIITDIGNVEVKSVTSLNQEENMYDFQLSDDSNKRYFTNGILSHNTELAKQITRYLFESDDSLIRIDMSEYMEKFSINRIIGSPQGYVGYDDSNVLDRIRRKPYSVVLFDEIEKAHKDVLNLFLQMLDDGHMTDSHGRKVSFKNCIILMTSNVGTKMLKDFGTGVGFNTSFRNESNTSNAKSVLEKELKKHFAPEFINRLDGIIYFKDLGKDEIISIVDLELVKTYTRAKNIGFNISMDDSLRDHLVKVGYDPQYGARPLKRAIQKWVDDAITDFIMESSPKEGSTLILSYSPELDKTVITTDKKKRKKSESDKQ